MRESKCIGVLTSGVGSSGINCAIRAIVRMGLFLDSRVFFIYDGYKGMMEGKIKEATWNDVYNVMEKGGSMLGSSACEEFRQREGRMQAALHLIHNGINNVICIGGDGSLQGLNIFKLEWPSIVASLLKKKYISEEQAARTPLLGVCGLVASIDNDFWGTDMTIGTDTALTRIIDCVDAVEAVHSTAQRAFVLEVAGRHCGYVAMTAGLACEADFVFVPEWPPVSDWENTMCKKMKDMKECGRQLNIIIVAEGAMDENGKRITPQLVKEIIETNLKYDTRITTLGHLQRGGSPSFLDRYLASRMGAEAAIACVQRGECQEPIFIALRSNNIERAHLTRAVSKTVQAENAYKLREYERCVVLRGANYTKKAMFLDQISNPPIIECVVPQYTFAVLHVGNPAAGMNAATHAIVRMARYHNCSVLGISNGFDGFAKGQIKPLEWPTVSGWVGQGGSLLGSSKELPDTPLAIAEQMILNNIRGLVIIGGFEAFHSACILRDWQADYDSLRVPITVIPASTCNNIPGVSESLGSDSALNEICRSIENIRQSVSGEGKSAFIVEVSGGYSGYLSIMAAIATGADNAHIFEEELTKHDIMEDVKEANEKLAKGIAHYLLIRTDYASREFNSKTIHKIFSKASRDDHVACHLNYLGQGVHGSSPTAYDRQAAIRMGARATERLLKHCKNITNDVEVIGVRFANHTYADVSLLEPLACFVHQNVRSPWWLGAHGLMRVLANHGDKYEYEIPPENSGNATRLDG